MAVSVARAVIGGACIAIGTTIAIGCATIGLFDTGAPAAAEHLGVAPTLAARSSLIGRAIANPGTITAADMDDARAAIRRRPLPAAPYYVLGAAEAANSDKQRGAALVDVALRHDPRLAGALLWRTRSAIAAGQYAAATEFNLRLLSLRPQDRAPLDLLVILSGIAETRKRIVAALARTPDWRSGYLDALSRSNVSRNFVYRAMQGGNPVEVNLASERSNFLTGMIARQEYERAYTAWVSWLPDDALSSIDYLYDGAFRGRPGAPPFNWLLGTIPNGSASIEPGSGLVLTFDGSSEAVLAQQLVMLPPGRYRIATAMAKVETGQQADSVPGLFWRLGCAGQSTSLGDFPVQLGRTDARTVSNVFEIKPDCPAINLELRVKSQNYPAQTSATMRSVAIKAES